MDYYFNMNITFFVPLFNQTMWEEGVITICSSVKSVSCGERISLWEEGGVGGCCEG